MQIRVVTAQPWEAAAELLVVPIVGEPDFGGPLGELDTRTGGELKALATFGELTGKRYATALASPGDLGVKRVLVVASGEAGGFDRETARRVAGTAIRRLIGREVRSMAVWLAPIADGLGGDAALAAELTARGVIEGAFEPKTIYREDSDAAPPALDELVLLVGAGHARRPSRAPSAAGSSARAPTSPAGWPTGPPTTSRPRSSPTRPGPSRRTRACRST